MVTDYVNNNMIAINVISFFPGVDTHLVIHSTKEFGSSYPRRIHAFPQVSDKHTPTTILGWG